MIGLSRISMIPAYSPPAAWMSGNTEAVYSSGTATSHQAGSRSQGTSTTRAAVAARISALMIAYGIETGPGGSARLASARQGQRRERRDPGQQPVPPQGRPGGVRQQVSRARTVRQRVGRTGGGAVRSAGLGPPVRLPAGASPFICLSSASPRGGELPRACLRWSSNVQVTGAGTALAERAVMQPGSCAAGGRAVTLDSAATPALGRACWRDGGWARVSACVADPWPVLRQR